MKETGHASLTESLLLSVLLAPKFWSTAQEEGWGSQAGALG